MSNRDYLFEDFRKLKLDEPTEKSVIDRFKDAFPYKLKGAAKQHFEALYNTLRNMQYSVEKYKNDSDYIPEIKLTQKHVDFLNKGIDGFISDCENLYKTNELTTNGIKTLESNSKLMNDILTDVAKYSYTKEEYNPRTLEKHLEAFAKNYLKNKDKEAEEAKAKEEEIRKNASADNFGYSDEYDSKKLVKYLDATSSKSEKLNISKVIDLRDFLMYRVKSMFKKQENINFGISALKELFRECDNAWFNYVYRGKELLLRPIYDKYKEYRKESKPFDKLMTDCESSRFIGGVRSFSSIIDCFEKAKNARIKLDNDKNTDSEYQGWEESIDSILSENGVPSLQEFLNNWVNETIAHYKDEKNIKYWKEQISEIEKKLEAFRTKKEEYGDYDAIQSLRSEELTFERYIKISAMPESRLRKAFTEEADAVKKDFVIKVCQYAGKVKDGVFNWGVDGRLNGTVIGEKAKVRVLSFFAGSANPMPGQQCLHVRTRITEIK